MSRVATATAQRLETATLRLTTLSALRQEEGRQRFAWPSRVSTERLATSQQLLALSGLPEFGELNDEQRWRLALDEAVHFFSLNIGGERELMSGIALRLYRGRPAFVSHYLLHFLEEESAHTAVFARFCLQYSGTIDPDYPLRFPRQFLPGEEEFVFFGRVLVFEEIAHFYNRRIAADPDVWSLAREINAYHAEDETRHIAFGRLLLDDLWERWAPQWSVEERRRIGGSLRDYMDSVVRSYVSPQICRELQSAPGLRARVLASEHWKSLSAASTARVTRWLDRFSEAGS